jgi:hypothetical protein
MARAKKKQKAKRVTPKKKVVKPATKKSPKKKPAAKTKKPAAKAKKPAAKAKQATTPAIDRIYLLEPQPADGSALGRSTQGGRPILAADQAWPRCHCGEAMTLFFQVDIPEDLPPFAGSHLLAFQCPKHNDAVFPPTGGQLVGAWWDAPGQFWRFLLNRKGSSETVAPDADPYIRSANLVARAATDDVDNGVGTRGFKLGGEPSWCQDPERYTCSCGAPLAFVAMVPENYEFATNPGQVEQPGWYRASDWALFLGNEVYIHACSAQCDPRAVWPINQN